MPAPQSGGVHDLVTRQAGLILQSELENPLMMFMGESDSDAFKVSYKNSSKRGSTERVEFAAPRWDDVTKPYGSIIVGQENQGTTEYDEVRLDFHQLDGKVENVIVDQQIVNWNLVDQEYDRLGSQWSYMFQKWVCHQMTGNVNVTASSPGNQSHFPLSASNDITAYDANHIIRAAKSDDTIPANDSAIDSTCLMTTDVITRCLTQGTSRATVKNPMAPCNTPFGLKYVLALNLQGFSQIESDDPRNLFIPLTEATLQGGMEYMESAIANYTGFIFKNCLVIHVPALDDPTFKIRGLSGTSQVANTGVGFFFGSCAGMWLFGEGFGDGDHIGNSEFKVHDYLSILTKTNCGFKRTIPQTSAETWGAIRVVHYSPIA